MVERIHRTLKTALRAQPSFAWYASVDQRRHRLPLGLATAHGGPIAQLADFYPFYLMMIMDQNPFNHKLVNITNRAS